jgi:TRAP transporter TAXI family solute receptor
MTPGRCFPCLLAGVVSLVLAGSACTRGADEARLRADVQNRLTTDVKSDLFEVVALRREGSAPMPASESGADRVIVYYNVTLRLVQDYTFGGWDRLGPSSVAFALGATEKGLLGLQPQNKAGDIVRAYGSAVYERAGDDWVAMARTPAQTASAPNIEGTAPNSRSKQFIDRLANMVNLPPPGVPPQQDEIIADELARASEAIERRVRRREHVFTIASGQEGGDYARFGAALIANVTQLAPAVKLRQRFSQGSVDNAWLLSRGEADYAIVQGDVAAAAVAGSDLFARGGALTNLRAVGSLFPEPIHVAVLADSPIRDVNQLRGKRVDLGLAQSGTHFDAAAVLDAIGVKPEDLAEASRLGPDAAIPKLRRKQLDAVFVTAAAPTRQLQELATQEGLRLLPLTGAVAERLTESRPGLTALILPANTYPGQREAVTTMASAALLVTTLDAPRTEVGRVADLVFARMPQQRAGGAAVVKVSSENELRGVTIPLHDGAVRRKP